MAPADARFMREAIAAAYRGVDAGQSPFGACVVRDGLVVAAAHNTVLRDRDPSAHAEVNALRAAAAALGTHDLAGGVVYATGEPCPMCLGCCYWAHVDRIVFGSSIADSAGHRLRRARLCSGRPPPRRRAAAGGRGRTAARGVPRHLPRLGGARGREIY
ncbi:MAG: nucleoside deaminase [Candidatus Binatia bacterium]